MSSALPVQPRPALMSSALVVPRVVPVVSTPVVVLGAGHQRALVGFQPRCAPPSAVAPSLVQAAAGSGMPLRPALMMGGGKGFAAVVPPGVKIIRPAAGARWRNNGGGGLRPLRPALSSSDPTGDFLARVSSRHTTAAAAAAATQSSQKLPLPTLSSTTTAVSQKTVPEGTATASQQAVVAAPQQYVACQQAAAVTQQAATVTQQAATASRQAVVAAPQQYAVGSQQAVALTQQPVAAVTQQAVSHPTTAALEAAAAVPSTQGLAESQAAAVSVSVAVRAADTLQTAAPRKTAAAPTRTAAGASYKRPDKRTMARAWPYRTARGTAGYYRPGLESTGSGIDTSKPWRFETEVKAGRPFYIFQSLRT
jgi:hypothetical protein